MNIYVLSEMHPRNHHVGWSVNYGVESTLVSTCNAHCIYPVRNPQQNLVQRYQQRLFKSWYSIDELPTLGAGPNILLIVGLDPGLLLSMFALGPLLQKFDLRVAYLLDGFDPKSIDREILPYLDHLFVITAEVADEINSTLPLPTTFLPLATDALQLGFMHPNRAIDIVSYGRTNLQVHAHLQQYYNQQISDRIYYHSTFSQPNIDNFQEHTILLSKLLGKSKISLCFEPSDVGRFRGYSPLLVRWFEGWSCGCTIVGRRPFGKGVDQLLDWENSTLELPEHSADWIPFFEALLNDEITLFMNSQRNYRECLLRHDWRYRLRDMFQTLELPLPEKLKDEIAQLGRKVEQVLV